MSSFDVFIVADTLCIGCYDDKDVNPHPGDEASQEDYAERFVGEVEAAGIDVIELKQASISDSADGDAWFLWYNSAADSWSEYTDEMAIITSACCGLFDDGLEVGDNGRVHLTGELPAGENGFRPGWSVNPHWCDDGPDELMKWVFISLTT